MNLLDKTLPKTEARCSWLLFFTVLPECHSPCCRSRCLSSPHDSDLNLAANISSLEHIHQLISQTSQLAKLAASLCETLPKEADSCSSSQWDICISVLFFITSIYPPQRRGTLMSFKSHYGWGSAPANTDFPWFCISGGRNERDKIPVEQNPNGYGQSWGELFETHSARRLIPSWRHTLFTGD